MTGEPDGVVSVGMREDHLNLRKGLPHLQFRLGSSGAAEGGNFADQAHLPAQVRVDQAGVARRIVGEVDALGNSVSKRRDGQIPPDCFTDKRHERRGQPCCGREDLVERPVRIEFVGVALR